MKKTRSFKPVVATSGGTSFASLLTLLFIALKLLGKISWKWVWVLCPLWISIAFTIIIWIFTIIVVIIAEAIDRRY